MGSYGAFNGVIRKIFITVLMLYRDIFYATNSTHYKSNSTIITESDRLIESLE